MAMYTIVERVRCFVVGMLLTMGMHGLAQFGNHFNVWYFGVRAGIDFNYSPPRVLFDGKTNHFEGTAVWCDANGKLLVYTDGITAWNGNHEIIDGATDLGGHTSTFEVLTVPRPGHSGQVYIISGAAAEVFGDRYRYYSLIDMNERGGRGRCLIKRQVLISDPTETVTAVPRCDGKAYWLLHTDKKGYLHVHVIDSLGLQPFTKYYLGDKSTGSLTYHLPTQRLYYISTGAVRIGTFDPSSGAYTPYYTLKYPDTLRPTSIEVSRNGKYLYFLSINYGSSMTYLLRFDVSVDTSKMLSTVKEVYRSTIVITDLQLAPDGKIYAAIVNKGLGCIQDPDQENSSFDFNCVSYSSHAYPLAVLPKAYWLTPWTREVPRYSIGADRVRGCADSSGNVFVTIDKLQEGIGYEVTWYLDGRVLPYRGDSVTAVKPGEYCARIRFYDKCTGDYFHSDTICITVEGEAYIEANIRVFESTPCDSIIDSVLIRVRGGVPPYRIAINNGLPVRDSVFRGLHRDSTYRFFILDSQNCTFEMEFTPPPPAELSIEKVSVRRDYCGLGTGAITVVPDGKPPYRYSLNGMHDRSSGTFDSLPSGTYQVEIRDAQGCTATVPVRVGTYHLRDFIHFQTTSDTCRAQSGALYLSVVYDSLRSRPLFSIDGSNFQYQTSFEGLPAGEYTLFVRDTLGCMFEERFAIRATEPPVIRHLEYSPPDCNSPTATVRLQFGGAQPPFVVLANDAPTFQLDTSAQVELTLPPGTHSLSVLDGYHCRVDTVLSIVEADTLSCGIYLPNAFHPDGDGFNDVFKIYTSSDVRGTVQSFRIYDRWGEVVYETHGEDLHKVKWDGRYKGALMPPGVYVYQIQIERGGRLLHFVGSVTLVR